MALDTREKRQAASAIGFYWAPTPTPNALLDVEWRQEVAWGYPGIAPDAPIVVVGGVVWMWVNGVAVAPANQAAGSQGHWMWVNGTVIIPPGGTWPAFPKRDEWRR